jgi:hypothetical protein
VALAEERGDVSTIARLLRLAEMEMRPYAKGQLTGTGGAPVEHHKPVDDREIAKVILLKLAKAKAAAEAEGRSETRDRKSVIGDHGPQAGRRPAAISPKDGTAETRDQKREARGQISQDPGLNSVGDRPSAIGRLRKTGPMIYLIF